MLDDRIYRCLECLDHTVSRSYDVSHISVTCDTCGEFARFVNEAVYEQFQDYEESPPADLEWTDLDRTQKLLVAERVTRRGHSPEDFDIG